MGDDEARMPIFIIQEEKEYIETKSLAQLNSLSFLGIESTLQLNKINLFRLHDIIYSMP